MQSEIDILPSDEAIADERAPEEQPASRLYRWVELLSAAMLALATLATAWSAYQSSRWNGDQTRHLGRVAAANINIAKFMNLAEQKLSEHGAR